MIKSAILRYSIFRHLKKIEWLEFIGVESKII